MQQQPLFPNSPFPRNEGGGFMRTPPPPPPPVLKPLVYCEFRIVEPAEYGSSGQSVIKCAVFACTAEFGLPLCIQHAEFIQGELEHEAMIHGGAKGEDDGG